MMFFPLSSFLTFQTFRVEAFSAVHEGCAPKPVSVKVCLCISVCHKAWCDFPKHPFLPPDACPPGPTCPSLLALLPSPVINVPLSHAVVLGEGGRKPGESCIHRLSLAEQLNTGRTNSVVECSLSSKIRCRNKHKHITI